jgi:exodeoxyribonuclease VII small subunit
MAETPDLPYEQARDELIAVVQKLETGGTSLEESLALWERGEQLAAICQQWLDGARDRLAQASGQVEPAQTLLGQEDESDET